MSSREKLLPLAFGTLCLLLLSAAMLPTHAMAASEKDKPAAAPPAPAVLVSLAKMRPLGVQTEFIGRIQAFKKVDLRARVTGFMREQNFVAGAHVKEGELLYLIEPEPFEANVAQQEAQVASAIATQENAIASLERYRHLESNKFASEATLDSKIADEKRAAASIKQSKASLQDAEIQLSYTRILAPLTGRIGRSAIDPGNLISPSSGVLATLVRTDKMYALFPVTQAELLQARKAGENATNLNVRAKLADGSFYKEIGVIDFLDVTVDSRTDGQMVRAVFPNPDDLLTDGQTVRLVIERKDPETFLTIPQTAISTDQGGAYVFVVDSDGTAHQRRIQLGQSRDALVAVTEGLKDGDRVVVQGIQKVRDGAKVSATVDDSKLSGNNAQQSQGENK